MQARSLMSSVMPGGGVRSVGRLPTVLDARERLMLMSRRGSAVAARSAQVRASHTHRLDVVCRGRRW